MDLPSAVIATVLVILAGIIWRSKYVVKWLIAWSRCRLKHFGQPSLPVGLFYFRPIWTQIYWPSADWQVDPLFNGW